MFIQAINPVGLYNQRALQNNKTKSNVGFKAYSNQYIPKKNMLLQQIKTNAQKVKEELMAPLDFYSGYNKSSLMHYNQNISLNFEEITAVNEAFAEREKSTN